MPNVIDLSDDDGFVTVKMGPAEVTLDLYQVNNQVHDYHTANKTKPDVEYNSGLVELIQTLGLPACSQRTAARFVEGIRNLVETLKSKKNSSAASPGSTASTVPG